MLGQISALYSVFTLTDIRNRHRNLLFQREKLRENVCHVEGVRKASKEYTSIFKGHGKTIKVM